MEPALELWVVKVGPPGVQAQRLPVAGRQHQLLIGHRLDLLLPAESQQVGPLPARIVPGPPANFGRRRIKEMDDVALLPPADLDLANSQPLDGQPAGRRGSTFVHARRYHRRTPRLRPPPPGRAPPAARGPAAAAAPPSRPVGSSSLPPRGSPGPGGSS